MNKEEQALNMEQGGYKGNGSLYIPQYLGFYGIISSAAAAAVVSLLNCARSS